MTSDVCFAYDPDCGRDFCRLANRATADAHPFFPQNLKDFRRPTGFGGGKSKGARPARPGAEQKLIHVLPS